MFFPNRAGGGGPEGLPRLHRGRPPTRSVAGRPSCAPRPRSSCPQAVRGKPVLAVIACYVGPPRGGRERPSRRCATWARRSRRSAPMPYEAVQGLIAPGNPPGRHHYWKAGFLGDLHRRGGGDLRGPGAPTWCRRSGLPDAAARGGVRACTGRRHSAGPPRRQVELPRARPVGGPRRRRSATSSGRAASTRPWASTPRAAST